MVLSFRAVLHISILAEWKGTYRSCGDATSTTFLKNWSPEKTPKHTLYHVHVREGRTGKRWELAVKHKV